MKTWQQQDSWTDNFHITCSYPKEPTRHEWNCVSVFKSFEMIRINVTWNCELVIQIVEKKLFVKLMKASDQKYIVNRNVRKIYKQTTADIHFHRTNSTWMKLCIGFHIEPLRGWIVEWCHPSVKVWKDDDKLKVVLRSSSVMFKILNAVDVVPNWWSSNELCLC